MHDLKSASSGIKAPLNEIEICYETFGDPRDPAVLLIAGFGEQMLVWESQFCNQLAAMGYWVIRYDNRDVGQSTYMLADAPSRVALACAFLLGTGVRTSYRLEDLAQDAVGLLDHLRVDKAHLIGRGLGGMVAQVMASHYKDRVESLASLMSSAGDKTLKAPSFTLLSKLFRVTPNDSETYVEHMAEVCELINGKRYPFDATAAMQMARQVFSRGHNEDGIARQLAAYLSAPDRHEALAELRIPALIIHGDADPLIPVEHGIDTAEHIQTANLRIIPGLGHTLPAAYWPDLIQDLLTHFNSS